MNNFENLRKFMVNQTKFYKQKKAKALTYNQIRNLLSSLNDKEDDLNLKMIIAFMYFGLLRGFEVLNVRKS